MSLINDALKRARQNPPRGPHNSPLPPIPPVEEPTPVSAWLVPAIVILLVVGAIFFIGWGVAHRSVHNIVVAPVDPIIATQQAEEVALPVVPRMPEPVPVNPPDAPRLQGIFYSPKSPTAIVNGKTVRPGDRFLQYRVAEITKYTVTLIGPDGKPIKLGMDN